MAVNPYKPPIGGMYALASCTSSSGYFDDSVFGVLEPDNELANELPYNIYLPLMQLGASHLPGKLNKDYILQLGQPTKVEGFDGKMYNTTHRKPSKNQKQDLLDEYRAIKENEMRYVAQAGLVEVPEVSISESVVPLVVKLINSQHVTVRRLATIIPVSGNIQPPPSKNKATLDTIRERMKEIGWK